MKVLLFTHEQDIDGLGCAVLAQSSILEYDLILSKTFELDEKIKKELDTGSFSSYDLIIVTDLCPNAKTLEIINSDPELSSKFQVLDHHKTAEVFNSYRFVKVTSENESVKESGTSLFYQFLKKNNFIEANNILNEFVELTRQYDTWDWYKNNTQLARELHIIFETQGITYYLKMINKIIAYKSKFELDEEAKNIVAEFDKKLINEINSILKNMVVCALNIGDQDFRIGYVKTLYKYRNDMAEIIRTNNALNIDVVGMINEDKDSVSYRSIKNVDVSQIAEYFGGGGHKDSASHPKDNVEFKRFVRGININ